jgi:hypothetical protein
MSISNKYNIPPETVAKMVRDGLISCLSPRDEKICAMYSQLTSKGVNKMEAYKQISDAENISERWVMSIIRKYS